MRDDSPKFNPAVLSVEAMQNFEASDTKGSRHFLYPGQVFVTREPIVISAILGSCATVCLWDRHKRAGGMNHYLLPEGVSEGENRLRYGNVANPELLNQVLALGCEIRNLQAKIFGGSTESLTRAGNFGDWKRIWDDGMRLVGATSSTAASERTAAPSNGQIVIGAIQDARRRDHQRHSTTGS